MNEIGDGTSQDASSLPTGDADADMSTVQQDEPDISSENMTELYWNICSLAGNGELPFVSDMDVTEHPNKIHVIVTTNNEEKLQKLKALDPIGTALEIEYEPGIRFVEE